MKTLAILVGGGPAPGINAVIAAAAIEARNQGLRVLGLLDGYKWLMRGDLSHVQELDIGEVSRTTSRVARSSAPRGRTPRSRRSRSVRSPTASVGSMSPAW